MHLSAGRTYRPAEGNHAVCRPGPYDRRRVVGLRQLHRHRPAADIAQPQRRVPGSGDRQEGRGRGRGGVVRRSPQRVAVGVPHRTGQRRPGHHRLLARHHRDRVRRGTGYGRPRLRIRGERRTGAGLERHLRRGALRRQGCRRCGHPRAAAADHAQALHQLHPAQPRRADLRRRRQPAEPHLLRRCDLRPLRAGRLCAGQRVRALPPVRRVHGAGHPQHPAGQDVPRADLRLRRLGRTAQRIAGFHLVVLRPAAVAVPRWPGTTIFRGRCRRLRRHRPGGLNRCRRRRSARAAATGRR